MRGNCKVEIGDLSVDNLLVLARVLRIKAVVNVIGLMTYW